MVLFIHIAVAMTSKILTSIMIALLINSIIRVFRSGSWEALPALPYPVADACMVWINHLYAEDNDDGGDADDNASVRY